jgi:ADP-ribose pyrophosphatase YjhB (NUDIX family)
MAETKFYYRNPGAPQPNKPNHIGVTAIIEHQSAVLMEYRSDCRRWSLIGGALELDESLTDCLRREIAEETSLTVSRFALFGLFSDPTRRIEYPDGNVIRSLTVAYVVEVEDTRRLQRSDESVKVEFVDKKDLPGLDVVETHRHILDSYIAWDRKTVVLE